RLGAWASGGRQPPEKAPAPAEPAQSLGGLTPPARPLYVVVEKILGYDEQLPPDWACDGTTGYEFLNAVNGLFVDPAGERPVTAAFPVYRSYVNGGVHETDQKWINRAVVRARKRNPLLGKPLFDFIRDTLLLKDPPSGPASDEYRAAQKRFAGKFQQLTAPVTAKGIEDTSFYVYNRFVS